MDKREKTGSSAIAKFIFMMFKTPTLSFLAKSQNLNIIMTIKKLRKIMVKLFLLIQVFFISEYYTIKSKFNQYIMQNPKQQQKNFQRKSKGQNMFINQILQLNIRTNLIIQMSTVGRDLALNGRAFKYHFDLEIQKLSMRISFPGKIQIAWRRKHNNIKTKSQYSIDQKSSELKIQEKLSLIATCYLHNRTKQFEPKQSTIQVIILLGQGMKSGGNYTLNLCDILNPFNQKQSCSKSYEVYLEKCPIPNSKICFKLSCKYIDQMKHHDQRSYGSGVNMNILNMSDYSITEARYSEKKCSPKKLEEVPSKQTFSVSSYNGIKYNTQKKEQNKQDDTYSSNSYGFPISIAKQYDFNRIPKYKAPERDKQGSQCSNKLAEEQKKRSKLQAQINKLNVYISEQAKRMNSFITQNAKCKEQLNKAKIQYQTWKNNIGKENQQVDNKNQLYKKQNEELKQNLSRQRNYYESMKRQRSQLEAENKSLNAEIDTLKYEIKKKQSIENFNEKLQEQLKAINYQLSEVRRTLQNQRKVLSNEKSEKYKLMQQRANNQAQIKRNFEKIIKQKDIQINNNRRNLDQLSETLKKAQENIMNMRERISHSENMHRILENENRSTRAQAQQLRQQKKKLQEMVYMLTEENRKAKTDVTKLRDEKTAQYEQRNRYLHEQNRQNQDKVAQLARSVDRLQDQIRRSSNSQMLAKEELEKLLIKSSTTQRQNDNLKVNLEINIEKIYALQRQNRTAKDKIIQLQGQLQRRIQQNENKVSSTNTIESDFDIDTILKENIELKLDLKYKNDELQRLKQIEQHIQNIKWNLSMEEKNRQQAQEQNEKLQREIREKNRSFILQVQKVKMLVQERNNAEKSLNQVRQQLDNCKKTIVNGQAQVRDMDSHIIQLENRLKNQENYISQLQRQRKNNQNSQFLQARLVEMQKRQLQKIKSLESANKNLQRLNEQIRLLQSQLQEKKVQICNKSASIIQLTEKIKALQSKRNHLQQQANKYISQKKNYQKKQQMLMQELHNYKKKFQQEKGRSTSVISIRTTQQLSKYRMLENQLNKKDEKIRKLEKQLLKLQEENIQLNIRIMKQLSDIKQLNSVTAGQ